MQVPSDSSSNALIIVQSLTCTKRERDIEISNASSTSIIAAGSHDPLVELELDPPPSVAVAAPPEVRSDTVNSDSHEPFLRSGEVVAAAVRAMDGSASALEIRCRGSRASVLKLRIRASLLELPESTGRSRNTRIGASSSLSESLRWRLTALVRFSKVGVCNRH